jgi:VanZ family protein
VTLDRRTQLVGYWAPVAVWMIAICALSSVPNVPGEPGLPHAPLQWVEDVVRGAAHLIEFGVLAALVRRALRCSGEVGRGTLLAAVWSLAYAAVDEVHQAFVAGRTCSVSDWALDALGVVLGLLLVRWLWPGAEG